MAKNDGPPLVRLQKIRRIIEHVDHRAQATDGPLTPTLQAMTQAEMSEIYRLAGGKPGSDGEVH